MYEPANDRQTETSPASRSISDDARLSFPRMLALATMALTLGLPGCHSADTQTAANAPSGDPSDVNAAQTQSTCPAGQMLMSDGSCAVPSQVAAAPAAGAPAAAPAASSSPPPAAPPP